MATNAQLEAMDTEQVIAYIKSSGAEAKRAQALFEAITSDEHRTDLTLPRVKSPTAAQRASWRTA